VHEDIDTLLTLLHEVAVLDVADLEKLKQRRHAARQVDNVDSWPLDQPSEAHNKKTI
jgi:hypothetical protein